MSGGNHSASHSELLATCASYLRWHGGHTLRILGGVGTRKGSPDLVAALAGRFICVDAKTGKAELDEHQQAEKDAYERAGALFVVVRRPEDLEDALVAAGLVTPAIQKGGTR
jgi:hypothetical protein